MWFRHGELINGVYTKEVNPAEHYMWKFKGYGNSLQILNELKMKGCKTIVLKIKYRDLTDIYKSNLKLWFDSKLTYLFKGTDLQKFLPLDDMELVDRKANNNMTLNKYM